MFSRSYRWLAFTAAISLTVGCKENNATSGPPPATPVLMSNNVGDHPSPLLRAVADSPIGWKQLTPTTINFARESEKILLVMACSSMFSADVEVLKKIDKADFLVQEIRANFVPVFVDVDSCREFGIIASILSQEIGKSITFPFLMWMTPDGNPVASLPLRAGGTDQVVQTMRNCQNVSLSISSDSLDYIKNNSRLDALGRRERLKPKVPATEMPIERGDALLDSLHNLHSYYEKDSLSIANTGIQLPITYLDFMRIAAQCPALPENERRLSRDILINYLGMMMDSAAIDFLDGGFYFCRKDKSWAWTQPDRNAITQADMVCLLSEAYNLTENETFRSAALRTMEFLEENFSLDDGSYYTFSSSVNVSDELRLLTMEDLKASLDTDEFALIKEYCAISQLGNLPFESDPRKEMFRRNSLTCRKPLAAVAKACSITELRAEELLATARLKLLKKRQVAMPIQPKEPTPDARATARAVSAAAAIYRMTGKERWKDMAVRSMQALRRTFHSSDTPTFYPASAFPSTTDARAGTVTQMTKAALDLHQISGDASWLEYAATLSKHIEATHLVDGFVEDTPVSARTIINVPCLDRSMLFDVSTTGILRQNLIRMEQFGLPRNELLYTATQRQIGALKTMPVLHTDYLISVIYEDFPVDLRLSALGKTEFMEAYRRSSPGLLRIDPAVAPTNAVALPKGDDQPIENPSKLLQLLRP